MPLNPLLPLMYEPLVRTALLEDLGRAGDITADAIVPADQQANWSCGRASRGHRRPRYRTLRLSDGLAGNQSPCRTA